MCSSSPYLCNLGSPMGKMLGWQVDILGTLVELENCNGIIILMKTNMQVYL